MPDKISPRNTVISPNLWPPLRFLELLGLRSNTRHSAVLVKAPLITPSGVFNASSAGLKKPVGLGPTLETAGYRNLQTQLEPVSQPK